YKTKQYGPTVVSIVILKSPLNGAFLFLNKGLSW
ncbi:glutathione S-transferase family protein, partial [Acinetobacter baumannii]